jgi:hypothetical protein
MSAHADLAESFMIFARYATHSPLSAATGLLYAGPDPAKMKDEDRERLARLGWSEIVTADGRGCWRRAA